MFELTVREIEGINMQDFTHFLIEKVREFFIDAIDEKQVERIDRYLQGVNDPRSYLYATNKKKQLSARDVLIGSIYNLIGTKTRINEYRIYVDPNIPIPGTNLKYATMLNMIDKGNMELSPYSIWSDTISHFSHALPSVLEEYLKEGE